MPASPGPARAPQPHSPARAHRPAQSPGSRSGGSPHAHPPYLTATIALALAPTILNTDPSHHHHQVRCGGRRSCIEAVAQRSCATRHDRRHCRIWRRWQHELDREQRTFRTLEHTTPTPAAPAAATAPSSFDQCVAAHESNGDWRAQTGNGYSGAYQFSDQTWQQVEAQMGVNWSSSAAAASPAEQTAAFNYWSSRDPGAWPNTIPMCGG